jgi:hypothetical protein
MTFFIEIGKNQSGISHGCTNDPKLTKQSWSKRAMIEVSQKLTSSYTTDP